MRRWAMAVWLAVCGALAQSGCGALAAQHQADAAFRKAITAQLAGDDELAQQQYQQVIALGLEWSPVWNNLAVIAAHRRQYSEARHLVARAVLANGLDVVALTNYGVLSYWLADFAEARRSLADARLLRRRNLDSIPGNGRTDWNAAHYDEVTAPLEALAVRYLDRIAKGQLRDPARVVGTLVAERRRGAL